MEDVFTWPNNCALIVRKEDPEQTNGYKWDPNKNREKPLARLALTTTQPWALHSIQPQNNHHTDKVSEEN